MVVPWVTCSYDVVLMEKLAAYISVLISPGLACQCIKFYKKVQDLVTVWLMVRRGPLELPVAAPSSTGYSVVVWLLKPEALHKGKNALRQEARSSQWDLVPILSVFMKETATGT